MIQIVLVLVTSATPVSIILVLCVLAGIGVAAAHVLPWAIIPDAIEWDEWRTGERHEGIFYSLTTLAHKMATSFSIPLVLLLLSFTGYEANAPQQPASALWGLRFVMGPLPAILLCAGIALAFKYPLSRARYERIVKRLQKRRARQKEKVPDGD